MNSAFRAKTTRHVSALVGRDREKEILDAARDAAFEGHGELVLLGGEAGIGKTALAEATCLTADEALILVGRCYELSETPPYGPWVELFSRYGGTVEQPERPKPFAQTGTIGNVTSQSALLGDIKDFFVRLTAPDSGGKQPVVLLLEDLHWADPASLELLRLFARDLEDIPILILANYRTDELTPKHVLAQLLPVLVRESRCRHFEVQRLEKADVEKLVRMSYALPDDDRNRLVDHLYHRADGNPFFTLEIMRTLEEGRVIREKDDRWGVGDLSRAPVPTLVRQVIEDRLTRLDRERRKHLSVAALIGQDISLPLWSSVAGGDRHALLETIERAVSSHLLEESPDGTGMRFVHALIRETLYERTPLPMRQMWHRHVAEAFIASGHPDPDIVANHLQRAGDGRAAGWLVLAGDRAQRAFAWQTAIRRYQAALELLEAEDSDIDLRIWIFCLLGLLHRYTDPRLGVEYLERGAQLAVRTDDPVLKAMMLYFQGHVRGFTGEGLRSTDQQSKGIAALDALDPAHRARFQTMLAEGRLAREYSPWASHSVTLSLYGRYRDAERVIQRLIEHEEHEHEGGQVRNAGAYRALTEIHAAFGRPERARQAATKAQTFFRELDHQAMLGNSLMIELLMAVLPYQTDALAERREVANAVERAWTRASGSVTDPDFSPRNGCLPLLIVTGEWEEAMRLGSTMLRLGWFLDTFAGQIAMLARWRGEDATAREIIVWAMPDGPVTPPGSIQFQFGLELQRLGAALALDHDDVDAALPWLEAHDRWLAWNGSILGRSEGHIVWAQWHRASGNRHQSSDHARAALDCASEPRQPLALIAAHRLLGELETESGNVDGARDHLQISWTLAEACAAPYERARTRIAMATLRRAEGNLVEARRQLAEARVICHRLGARLLESRIDDIEAETTSTPPALPGGITQREAEVLRLVAQGFDNAGIAERLFISPHTVHRHMSNILTKLDVPTRTAAVAWALRRGIL